MSSTADSPAPRTRSALVIVYISFVVRYATLLILLPFYTRVLGPAEYGQVLAAMALYGIVWAVVNWGYSPVGTRELAVDAADATRWSSHLSRQIGGRLMLVPLGLAIGALGTAWSPLLRAEPWIGVLATAAGIVSAFNLGWFYQAVQRYRTLVGLEVASFLLQLGLVLLLVRTTQDGVLVAGILLASLTLPTLFAYVMAWRAAQGFSVRIDPGLVREALPVFALINVASMSLLMTTYLLSLFAPPEVVGWFGTAERITSVLVAALAPAAQVMLGAVSRRLAQTDSPDAAYRLMAKGIIGLTGFGFITMLVVAIAAPVIVPWALGPSFEPSARLLQQLVVLLPFAAFVQAVSMYVLIPSRRESSAVLCVAFGACLGLTVLCVVGPVQPAPGAVSSRIVAEVLTALALGLVLLRHGLASKIFRSLRSG